MLSLLIDNTASRSSSSRCAIPERVVPNSSQPARGHLPAGATAEAGDAIVSRSPDSVTGTPFTRPALSAVPGDEPSIPSSAAGGAKIRGCNRVGRADAKSAYRIAQAEQVATSFNRGRHSSQADLPTASAGASVAAASPFYHGNRSEVDA